MYVYILNAPSATQMVFNREAWQKAGDLMEIHCEPIEHMYKNNVIV